MSGRTALSNNREMVGPAGPVGTVEWAHRAPVAQRLPWGSAYSAPPKKSPSRRLDAALRGNLVAGQASPPMVAETVEVILNRKADIRDGHGEGLGWARSRRYPRSAVIG